MEIKNSVVMITGGAIRVGRAVALYLASRGAHIAFSYLPGEPWQDTVRDIRACGVNACAAAMDVRDTRQIEQFVETALRELGRIDVLINSASVWLRKPVLDVTETDWDQAIDINLKGPFFLAQAVGRAMLEQGHGVIINITDGSAFQVWPGYAPHGASKTGLIALTKSFALELAPTVRVNAIAPGTVLMPPNTTPEVERWAMGHTILGRIGVPEDVAKMAEFIIERDYATGAVYLIDGGMSLVNKD
jgi:NAD(P)-dependent dehydrogenase (short-subunit alcohol dehydrogenase family)